MDDEKDIRKYFQTALILAGAMMGALLIYLLAIEILRAKLAPFTGILQLKNPQSVRLTIYFIAAFQVIVIRLLRGFLLRAKKNETEKKLINKLFRVSVISSILAQVPALLGFLLFLISGLNGDFYILLFVSFFLTFMFFPRISNWRAWVRNNSSSSCGV